MNLKKLFLLFAIVIFAGQTFPMEQADIVPSLKELCAIIIAKYNLSKDDLPTELKSYADAVYFLKKNNNSRIEALCDAINNFADTATLEELLTNVNLKADGPLFLFRAAAVNNTNALRLLIDQQGLSVNLYGTSGETPLSIAVEKGSKEALQFLLEKKAAVSGSNAGRQTCLMLSIIYGHREIAEMLIDNKVCLDSAGVLIDHKLFLNSVDLFKNRSALMYAVVTGQDTIVNKLIKAGADMNLADNDNCTALDLAKLHKKHSIKKILKTQNAHSNNYVIGNKEVATLFPKKAVHGLLVAGVGIAAAYAVLKYLDKK